MPQTGIDLLLLLLLLLLVMMMRLCCADPRVSNRRDEAEHGINARKG